MSRLFEIKDELVDALKADFPNITARSPHHINIMTSAEESPVTDVFDRIEEFFSEKYNMQVIKRNENEAYGDGDLRMGTKRTHAAITMTYMKDHYWISLDFRD